MSNSNKYRKRPVVIEARQFCGGGAGLAGGPTPDSTSATHAIYRWIERNTLGSFDPTPVIEGDEPWPESGVSIDPRDGRMIIATLEGGHWVNLFDWVIRGVQGEFYPCKPDIFEATYSSAEPSAAELALDVPLEDNDSGASTVRGYLLALLAAVWNEGEGFSGKRPFGNSGWEWDLIAPLVKARLVKAELDEDGYVAHIGTPDENDYRALITAAIQSLAVTP